MNARLQLNELELELQLSSRRRSVSIQVKQGQVRVLAPDGICRAALHQLLAQKQQWIESKLKQQSKLNFVHPQVDILAGTGMPLFGQWIPIQLIKGKKWQLNELGEAVQLYVPDDCQPADLTKLNQQVFNFYKLKADDYLPQRVAYWAKHCGLKPSALNIRRYRARWGSCNNHKQISLNYLLMMTPDYVIDYVIVHELCHIRYLNHSPSFWQLVQQVYPHTTKAKQWLRKHGFWLNWPL